MNLFNVMKERLEDLGKFEELKLFYDALLDIKDSEALKSIIDDCNKNYFKLNFTPTNLYDKYDVGFIAIEFDDESPLYHYTYTIYLSFVSCSNTYLPKLKIEKNELLKAFVGVS